MLRYTVRPISDRTWQRPGEREQSRFTTTWSDTLGLLERELRHLEASDLVIEVDVRERDIRLDGLLRADARSSSPGVVVAFQTPELGALQYRLDRFERPTYGKCTRMDSWQHNVRGVALTLESLRAVDRYGPTRSAQQYQGYRAIGSGPATPLGAGDRMVPADAAQVISDLTGVAAAVILQHPDTSRAAYRRAARRAHPDTGGDREQFIRVAAAGAVLNRHHGGVS